MTAFAVVADVGMLLMMLTSIFTVLQFTTMTHQQQQYSTNHLPQHQPLSQLEQSIDKGSTIFNCSAQWPTTHFREKLKKERLQEKRQQKKQLKMATIYSGCTVAEAELPVYCTALE